MNDFLRDGGHEAQERREIEYRKEGRKERGRDIPVESA